MTGDLNSCHVIKHSDNWHPHYQAKSGGGLRFWNLLICCWMYVDLDVKYWYVVIWKYFESLIMKCISVSWGMTMTSARVWLIIQQLTFHLQGIYSSLLCRHLESWSETRHLTNNSILSWSRLHHNQNPMVITVFLFTDCNDLVFIKIFLPSTRGIILRSVNWFTASSRTLNWSISSPGWPTQLLILKQGSLKMVDIQITGRCIEVIWGVIWGQFVFFTFFKINV